MNTVQFFRVCEYYQTKLRSYGAKPMEPLVNPQAVDFQTLKTLSLCHALYMVEKMTAIYPTDREKAMRWLGFVQGVFYMTGYMTIEQLKEDNRSCTHPGYHTGELCSLCQETVTR